MTRCWTVCGLLFGLGMALLGTWGTRPAAAFPGEPIQGVLFIVNGSGDSTTLSENCENILDKHRYPLRPCTVRWCRWADMAKDHCDYYAQVTAAQRLANVLTTYRSAHPHEKIYLIGHSAGTHVILAAANQLPPDSVDRIVLLASSVSYCYDIHNALRASREGIDAMYSREDQIVARGTDWLGTADDQFVQAAGAVGFLVPPPTDPEAGLYIKLRQYRWHPNVSWTGHMGGHNGFTLEKFLDAYVFPKMLSFSFVR
jgi:pimeloyl-ACP methyl ester carboxylesterase